jgi:predicted SnoaL-like aldol condensation-catalyzing enzyme
MRALIMIGAFAAAMAVAAPAVAQSNNYTAQEQQNLMVVQGFWNNVFMARNPERAREYLADNYLEHNPAVPGSPNGGIKAFVDFLNMFRARAGGAAPGGGRGPAGLPQSDVVLTTVDGDVVTMLRRQPAQDVATGERYEAFGFEMFRVRDGKIVEHWDAARRIPPGGLPPGGGPAPAGPGRGAQ